MYAIIAQNNKLVMHAWLYKIGFSSLKRFEIQSLFTAKKIYLKFELWNATLLHKTHRIKTIINNHEGILLKAENLWNISLKYIVVFSTITEASCWKVFTWKPRVYLKYIVILWSLWKLDRKSNYFLEMFM